MTLKTLVSIGTFTEVAYFRGQWYVCWQYGTVLRVIAFGADLGPADHPLDIALPLGDDAGSFPKMAVMDNALRLAYRLGAPGYVAILMSLTNDDTPEALGTAYGNDPVILSDNYIAFQKTGASDYRVFRTTLSAPDMEFVRSGAPTGLSRILPDGTVRTVDEDRQLIAGYTRPSWAGDAVAVEGDGLYDLVIRSDGKQVRLFEGQESYTPRLATDGTGRYLLGTWGKEGVRIALIEATDFATPAPPVDPTLPDIPWTSDPVGTPFDIEQLIRGSATAEQNGVLWYRKNDPVQGDPWGAWLDIDAAGNVGLLADSSTGQATADGRINWMYFDGPRLWMPLKGLSGWHAEYDTDFVWRDGIRTHEHIRVVMESGYGRYDGIDVFYRHTYDPRHQDPSKPRKAGLLEYSYYSRLKEERFEEHRDDDHGVPQFVRAVQPVPFTDKEAFVGAPRPQPYGPIEGDEMNAPGVTIDSYGTTIRPGQPWAVEWHDRFNDIRGKVEIVNGSVHVSLSNAKGSDRSGNNRPVAVQP